MLDLDILVGKAICLSAITTDFVWRDRVFSMHYVYYWGVAYLPVSLVRSSFSVLLIVMPSRNRRYSTLVGLHYSYRKQSGEAKCTYLSNVLQSCVADIASEGC